MEFWVKLFAAVALACVCFSVYWVIHAEHVKMNTAIEGIEDRGHWVISVPDGKTEWVPGPKPYFDVDGQRVRVVEANNTVRKEPPCSST